MADTSRIEDLRRRVQRDPASIAFAQLAEECRRAGQYEESVDICRAGLAIHPGYLSARVTLGRSLVELNQLDDALGELEHVLVSAPENLAAIRGVAEIHHRRGNLADALHHYRAALELAKNDPDLQETVNDLAKQVEPPKPPPSAGGLSLEQMTQELFVNSPPPVRPAPAPVASAAVAPASELAPQPHEESAFSFIDPVVEAIHPDAEAIDPIREADQLVRPEAETPADPDPAGNAPIAAAALPAEPPDTRAVATVAALEQWLAAVHAARTERDA